MKNYIGIDLGTTNSAICSYDGLNTRIYKSPEQNDVTPSAIFFEKRGGKYIGQRAYEAAPRSPENAAVLFKRLMGTSTPIHISALGVKKTPEECSAEILKVLFGYLPDEIRKDSNIGSVITVPAAFNQMQKDATMQAAELAGIGKVALMQEPVAAVMSVARVHNKDGMFLIYDFGGGTLDIAIAEMIRGHVNLLAHGGIAMCGGRDFDRLLVDNVIRPWLFDTFKLPEDFSVNTTYKTFLRLAAWVAEKAKIELSSKDESIISLSESEAVTRDLSGNEMYISIRLNRKTLDELISELLNESINAARDTLSKANLSPNDMERIVFVGGPTNYKPLRAKVAFELGISENTDLNPMTAVAEGAALFAESIDWDTVNRSRKKTRDHISSGIGQSFKFQFDSRTPGKKAKIVLKINEPNSNASEFQIDSIDTGWTSGRHPFKNNAFVEVDLSKMGENLFKAFVFDLNGGPIALEQDKISITRTTATVDAIPASHSISIEVLNALGGHVELEYLVKSGDPLPSKGKKKFKVAEALKAGANSSINIKMWEGEIETPIDDNRSVGVLKIAGSDIENGVIHAGADIDCEYEILDSGNIIISVSVPSVGFHSGKRNYYSRQESLIDYSSVSKMVFEVGERTLEKINEISEKIEDKKIEQVRKKLQSATSLDPEEKDPEIVKKADDNIKEAHKLMFQIRKEHLKEIRQIDLDGVIEDFNKIVRKDARPSEITNFDNLVITAQRSIDSNSSEFEHILEELKSRTMGILWRQDWFVVERFKWLIKSPHVFADKQKFEELSGIGLHVMRNDDIQKLREIVIELDMIRIDTGSGDDMKEIANIVRG